ncbi:hypothetical protein WQ57_05720 [Mesobacillus campisalis]|uniref:Uncharacterized protein n=1 Tax=Mesobacillus campisalis TaxID=1408103 RepID=A0A0M2SYS7_9BACI|nr:hypothetical protein [Mesobacillus campisalis]KKK38851.1 hypothetical protein WQ57_05720 [Mesobacillus campisalis]
MGLARIAIIIILVMIGGTGCMQSEGEIVSYLEEKYNSKFEVEGGKEGSDLFPDMYGKDQIVAHPEGDDKLVFLAGESKTQEGGFFDRYPLAKWSNELDEKYSNAVAKEFGSDAQFKTLLYVQGDNYSSEMIDMHVEDYFKSNQEALVTLNIGIKTAGEPNVDEYLEGIYSLQQQLKELGVESYGVTVGFVDESEDISDYIRTSNVNNLPWSNLDAKVYGSIMIDNLLDIQSPEQIKEYYEPIEG